MAMSVTFNKIETRNLLITTSNTTDPADSILRPFNFRPFNIRTDPILTLWYWAYIFFMF